MKKIFFLLLLSTLGYISCTDQVLDDKVNDLDSQELELRAGPKISIKVVPHRKIKNRRRDGKECDCHSCFGVCKIEFSVGWELKPGFHDGEIDPNDNILTIIDPVYDEDLSEFIVDTDISIELPTQLKEEYDFEVITIKKGSYNFIVEETDSENFGYVQLNIEYN